MDEPLEPLLSERFQRRATVWLLGFSAVSIAVALVGPFIGGRAVWLAMMVPFVHCPVFWVVLALRALPNPWMSTSSMYIKERHADVWKKLHPWGDFSHNTLSLLAFVSGHYDDGSDSLLQLIKARWARHLRLQVWPFALILVCWIMVGAVSAGIERVSSAA